MFSNVTGFPGLKWTVPVQIRWLWGCLPNFEHIYVVLRIVIYIYIHYIIIPKFYHVGKCPRILRGFNGLFISSIMAVAHITEGTLMELWFFDVIASSTVNEVALDEPTLLEG